MGAPVLVMNVVVIPWRVPRLSNATAPIWGPAMLMASDLGSTLAAPLATMGDVPI